MNKLLEPCNDRVVVKPIDEGEQMYGSIVVPDMGKEKPEMGTVISVGPGRQTEFGHFIRVNAKVGDVVLIPDGAFHQVQNTTEEDLYFVCVFEGSRDH